MKKIIILCVIILFSESVHYLHAQSPSDKFKSAAILNMDEGRYGEAIDLLNKYISENPQRAEGYYLRGLCYEARGQYEYSVYDLRSASKINNAEAKLKKALSRVTNVWYTQLYNKIEGHKREIAINPSKPINYLEIGKSYKNLGNWPEAEEWYDKYIILEEPSADEVIRYTEILAKNNQIRKGEIILKKFVEKYPEDHRLWSRYGYFTLWLGKNRVSISAFTEALKYRPYFKEAIDGLNLAQGKGAVYTVNDTTYQYNKSTGTFQKTKGHQYPIDKYFRMLKSEPSNDSVRIILIGELLKVNRLDEARKQFDRLDKRKVDRIQVDMLAKNISDKLDQYMFNNLEIIRSKIYQNPNDRKSVIELANIFTWKNNIDSVEQIYLTYLNRNPDDEIRFELAKKYAWFKVFEKARAQVNILLEKFPDRPEYQLLRGQISVWTNTENTLADSIIKSVLKNEPSNIQALTALAILNYQSEKFTSAEDYIEQIEKLDPKNLDVKELRYNLNIQKQLAEEAKLERLLESARNSLSGKKCQDAVKLYKEYLSVVPINDGLNLELANAYVCANDFSNAIKIYSDIIDKKYDFDLAKQRAKLFFWAEDSVNALNEFRELHSKNADDVEVKLFLGDSYFKMRDYANAKKIYIDLINESPSSKIFRTRLSWLPQEAAIDGSFSSFIMNFPSYMLLTPEVYHFKDNLNFEYNLQGLRAEMGVTKYLSAGGSIYRGDVSSNLSKLNLSTITGNLLIIPNKQITAQASFGQTKYMNNRRQNLFDVSLRSEVENHYRIVGRYSIGDAAQILYSPFIIDTGLAVTDYSVDGMYFTPNRIILSGIYSHKKISDGNKSNLLVLKLGRKFDDDFTAGYEYYYLKYDFVNLLYYSPERFDSHSLWASLNIINDQVMSFSVGGKIGLIPSNDFLIKEFNSKLALKIFNSFTLQGQLVFSENSREQVNYRSTSISINAFWVF